MTITIGELASRTGVGIETIRFYEKKGLIPDPERSHSGYRQYPEDAVRRIRFVLHAKDLGFSLAEIGELLSLRVDSRGGCASVKEKAQKKIDDMEQRIEILTAMRARLSRLIGSCEAREPTSECPILEVLENVAWN